MKLGSFIILAALICYILAVGHNVLTVNNLDEEIIKKNTFAIIIEVAKRLDPNLLSIIGGFFSGDILSAFGGEERLMREAINVICDWYAPIKWPPVLSLSKEICWLITRRSLAGNNISKGPNVSSSNNYAYVKSDGLNVRSGPSTNYGVIGRLSKNTRLEIINKQGTWWKIRSGNIEGYVNSQYLRN